MRKTWVKWNLKWQSRATESRRKWTEVIPFSLKIANRGKGRGCRRKENEGERTKAWLVWAHKPEDFGTYHRVWIWGGLGERLATRGWLLMEREDEMGHIHTPTHTVYRNTQEKGYIVHKDQEEAMKYTEKLHFTFTEHTHATHGCCHSVFCTTMRVQGLRTSNRKHVVKLPVNFTYLLTLLARALIMHWFDSCILLKQ